MTGPAYATILVVLAVLLDFGLIFWTRSYVKKRGIDKSRPEGAIYVFGSYSPVLTWLKNRRQAAVAYPGVVDQGRISTPEQRVTPASAWEIFTPAKSIPLRTAWVEWGIITLAVLLFCSGILDLRADTRLPGNETEVFQALDWTLINSLGKYGQFPFWNPFIYTGLPYIADPMLHAYNPVVSAPVLLFGVRAGFKIAVFLSFLFAALGMWRLGAVLGFSRPVRLWAALTYVFAGQPVARFFQGQYLFVFGFAWIPWLFASLIILTATRRRVHLVPVVLFTALLFFSGNDYYPFYTLIACLLFALVMTARRRTKFPFFTLEKNLSKTYVLVAVFVICAIAVQLLPLAEFWPHLSKDLHLEGSHTLGQILLDLTSKDTFRPDAFAELPAREEFYAYIGVVPLFGLILLPLAFYRRNRRLLVFFSLILVTSIVWISLDYLPWRKFFVETLFLLQFRHLLRILLFASFAIIVLAGYAYDTLWKFVRDPFEDLEANLQEPGSTGQRLTLALHKTGLALIGAILFVGAGDLFLTHQPYIRTVGIFQPAYLVTGWLRQNEGADSFLRPEANNQWQEAVISQGFRYIETWYHFNDIRSDEGATNKRRVEATPNYYVASTKSPAPTGKRALNLAETGGYNIYQMVDSLPMAFSVDDTVLQQSNVPEPLMRSEVTPLTAFFPGPNDIEVITDESVGSENQTLVVLTTRYPGWRLKVDGRPADLVNISGYLAARMLPGVHKYTFSFRPGSFYLGMTLSLIAAGVCLYLLFDEARSRREEYRLRWSALKEWLKQLPPRFVPEPMITAMAVYRQGVLQLEVPLSMPEDSQMRVTVEPGLEGVRPLTAAARRWLWATYGLFQTLAVSIPLETTLFSLAALVYLAVHLIGLVRFPIYFFTDEAVQTLLASDFIRDGFRNAAGEFFPTYFRNVDHYNLSTSVYAQVVPYLMFGKSVFVTRATSVLLTLLAAFSVSLILRDFFKLKHWWIATLVLSATPAWFLHSRTAFETVLMVSFYSAGMYFYLKYRYDTPKSLYPALVFFGLAFYSYSPGQVVVVLTGLLLLVADFRYHWANRQVTIRAVGLLLLIVLPYLRFRWEHPNAIEEHLANLNSYWLSPMPLREKFSQFFHEYLYGLSPGYWFRPNDRDLVRHLMKGYGHVHWLELPFAALGLGLCAWKWRSPAHRLVVISFLAAPAGAALAQIAVTRALMMVIPLTLMACIGLLTVVGWLSSKRNSNKLVALGLFSVLSLANFGLLRDALVNGPTWYQDYGLGGMQYGGIQLFQDVQGYLKDHPGVDLIVTPTWANGPDILARYFLGDPLPVRLGNLDPYLERYTPMGENQAFVLTPSEYQQAVDSGKFTDIQVDWVTKYPNDAPGFYFTRLQYVAGIESILQAEQEARHQLQEGTLLIDGSTARVRFSMLDMGSISDILDGNQRTLARTLEANPFVIEITFPEVRPIGGMTFTIGDTEVDLTLKLSEAEGAEPVEYHFFLDGSFQQPQVSLTLDQVRMVKVLYIEIKDRRQEEPGHVHLWEIKLQ